MGNSKTVLVFTLLLFNLIGCNRTLAPENAKLPQPEVESRNEITTKCFMAGVEVTKKTDNTKALYIMELLATTCVPATPIHTEEGASIHIEATPDKNSEFTLFVVPLLPEDAEVDGWWKSQVENKMNSAVFHPAGKSSGILILNMSDKISPTWMGLIIIHMGANIADHVSGDLDQFNDDPLLQRAITETNAYAVEIELAEAIGGKEYSKLVDLEVARQKEEYAKGSVKPPDYKSYTEQLNAIFGKSKSEEEDGIRNSILWINGIFRMIDNSTNSQVDSDNAKTGILLSMYQSGNMQ